MNMVERVARALLDAHDFTNDGEGGGGFYSLSEDWQANLTALAAAAIAAMREPTPEMLDAGFLNGWDEVGLSETYPHQRGIWRAMIDAALSSPVHSEEPRA